MELLMAFVLAVAVGTVLASVAAAGIVGWVIFFLAVVIIMFFVQVFAAPKTSCYGLCSETVNSVDIEAILNETP